MANIPNLDQMLH